MSRFIREKPLTALWITVGVVIVGRLVDLQWHLSHDEFEGTGQQFRAHTLIWIGVLSVLTVTVMAIRAGVRNPGFTLALAGSVFYVPVAVWHFIEHANGTDPDVAHVLLGVADVMIIGGAIVASLAGRRDTTAEAAGLSE